MAYITLILHVNGVPMIIIGISAYIHIHPAYILHIKDSVCIELLGVLCTPLKNIMGARAPLAPPFLRLCSGTLIWTLLGSFQVSTRGFLISRDYIVNMQVQHLGPQYISVLNMGVS